MATTTSPTNTITIYYIYTYTITRTFTGWWVARNGKGLNIHPFTTEAGALNYVDSLTGGRGIRGVEG